MKFHLRSNLLKSSMYGCRKQNLPRKVDVEKIFFLWKFEKLELKIFLNIRKWSGKLSMETLLVEID